MSIESMRQVEITFFSFQLHNNNNNFMNLEGVGRNREGLKGYESLIIKIKFIILLLI